MHKGPQRLVGLHKPFLLHVLRVVVHVRLAVVQLAEPLPELLQPSPDGRVVGERQYRVRLAEGRRATDPDLVR